ncbi:MAG: pyridoxal-phosphate dependent enzyme [Thermoanaerobaculales bacterium]|jgi:threonine dehydratase|nr:pyridoxal-phosphate dependent enzyme [Thermoanaerobaculales bacterium]
MHDDPTIGDVRAAAERIAPHIHRTPVATCAAIDHIAGAALHFKCEHLQKVGAFKARGATNAVFSLAEDQAAHGVCTHSSGNHAAALARAAALRGIPAHIVMPSTAPPVKRAAVAGYGAAITGCEPTLEAREATLARVQEATGAIFIHPYDDPRVIAGQGTAALELLEQAPGLEVVLVPVGGGGLASGTTIAVRAASPETEVWGAEPAGADDAFRSLRDGRRYPSVDPRTVADGLRTALSDRTFRILSGGLAGIVTVDEPTIIRAMRLLWERAKLLVEPSAAVPLAALLAEPGRFHGRRVGIILSGGNVDLDRLPW